MLPAEGLVGEEFPCQRATGPPELTALLVGYPPDRVAALAVSPAGASRTRRLPHLVCDADVAQARCFPATRLRGRDAPHGFDARKSQIAG